MKRKLLLFTLAGLLSVGTLASCNRTTTTSTPSPTTSIVTTISITNKTTLQEAWRAGAADRLIAISIYQNDVEQEVNINALINSGVIDVTSSNSEVVLVNGRYISAISEGTATITVSYNGTTDSVSLTIDKKVGAPDFIVAPLADIFAADDTDGKNAYITSGTVVKGYYNNTPEYGAKGRFWVKDDAGVEYIIYDATTNADDFTFNTATERFVITAPSTWTTNVQTMNIKAGDKINFIAHRGDYGEVKEVKALLLAVNDAPIYNGDKTVTELLALPASTQYLYRVKGTIASWQGTNENGTRYGNFMLKTEGSEDTILVYGATASADALALDATTGQWKFTNPQDFLTNGLTSSLAIGDEVTLVGYRLDYNTTIEFQGVIQSDATTIPEPAVKTVSSIDAIINDSAKDLAQKYSLDLYVKSWYNENTDLTQYGNFVAEDVFKSTSIVVYGATATASALTYSEESGLYSFSNPRDALTNNITKDIAVNSKVTVEVVRTAYKETPQLYAIIKSVAADDRTKTEPATKTVASIKAAIDDSAAEMEQTFTIVGYVEKFNGTATDTTRYGNFYITDADGSNSTLVYGSTATATALAFNHVTGKYVFSNPQDALTNDITKTIAVKSKVTLKVCVTSYRETKQLTGIVVSVAADDR